MTHLFWFRRDLRLRDHPALVRCLKEPSAAVFVLDPKLLAKAGQVRKNRLFASLAALHRDLVEHSGGGLTIRTGDPVEVIPALARDLGATEVHVSAETTPFGRRRDNKVAQALEASGISWVATSSPYIIGPGSILNGQGTPYRVYTPFSKAWKAMPLPTPAGLAQPVGWLDVDSEPLPPVDSSVHCSAVPAAGEQAALKHWRDFLRSRVQHYADGRDRPDQLATSGLSTALHFGEIHPRTLLADVNAWHREHPDGWDPSRFISQLIWREFYADVLWHRPDTVWAPFRSEFAAIQCDDDKRAFDTWCAGQTGYPIIDAAMRQLRTEGWLPNRVRMLVGSFLVKDLHLPWQWGAQWFLTHLTDADVTNNQHGWQWVAGCGTDAAPYFRIFNPTTQAKRFDPDGDYVRAHVPELAHLHGATIHEPWDALDGYHYGYPEPMIDHSMERDEALRRFKALSAAP